MADVVRILAEIYPDIETGGLRLNYDKPYELLFAGMLSAQCRDERVNAVTAALFEKYPSLSGFAAAEVSGIEEIVRTCGLYRTKARNISAAAHMLVTRFGGELPQEIDELATLPGVGRKTANLVAGDIFGKPAVVTDTHVIRISNRLGLIDTENPAKAERQLREVFQLSDNQNNPHQSRDFCHRMVFFGRDTCRAKKPLCDSCRLKAHCIIFNTG
ncbi:endonuclease III [Clostridia bacterium]|nr:endonuclease III [Clostridia bacterium]